MALSSYAELQTSVLNFLNITDTATVAAVPDFIRLAEARMRRDLRGIGDDVVTTSTIPAGGEMTLPGDIVELRSISRTGTAYRGPLEIVSLEKLWKLRSIYTGTGIPVYAAIAGNEVHTCPIADVAYDVEIRYTSELSPLESAGTNWILQNHPDVYLYASLAEAAAYVKNDARIPVWNQRYEEATHALRVQRDRIEFPNTPRPILRALG